MIKNIGLSLLVILLGLFSAGTIGVTLESKIEPAVYVKGSEWNLQVSNEMARINTVASGVKTEETAPENKIAEIQETEPPVQSVDEESDTQLLEDVTVNELDDEETEVVSSMNNSNDGEGIFQLDEYSYLIGTVQDGEPTGKFVHISNDRVAAYGEIKNGQMIDWSEIDEPFSCYNDQFLNDTSLKDKAIFVDYVKKDGILNLLTDDVIKVSLSETNYLYLGKTKDNLAHGKGTLYRLLGHYLYYRVYSGEFKDGYFDGDGTYYSANGYPYYVGDFTKGLEDGKGKSYDSKGLLKYEGYYKNGSYDKKGKLYSDGVLVYDGEWKTSLMKSGVKEGKGKSYYHNGQLEYDGEWKDNKFHGKGKYYDQSGKLIYKGKFKNGDPE